MKNGTKIVFAFLLLILLLSFGMNAILFFNNEDLQHQIVQRDVLIQERQVADSSICVQHESNERIVKKYIDDCGILINDKRVSTKELLEFINERIKLNDQLEYQLKNCYDSLSIYKSYSDLAKKIWA